MKKLHTRSGLTNKYKKTNELRLHAQNWCICGQMIFVFKYAEFERGKPMDF